MHNILFIFIASLSLSLVFATDYCKKRCDRDQYENIGCNNKGDWDASCPSDKVLLTLTAADKNAIVNRHNQHRNFIAGGGETKLKAACRMATMKWNDELAYLASLNVKSCRIKHDACRNTDQFDWAGQNLAWLSFFNPLNTTGHAIGAIDNWYNEVSDVQQSHIESYPSKYEGPAIGHFTVMVADRNTDVGCAVSTFSVKGKSYKAFLMACNYAANNVPGVKMYNSCSAPAIKCSTGVNPSYRFLCNSKEIYDVNNLKN